MCGVSAILSKTIPSNLSLILKSAEALKSRGPDSSCTHINNKGIYIFYRLCVNDLSTSGNQPFTSGNITLLCNGEIYNYKELVEKYDLTCSSTSDCEVILRLYEKLGSFTETVKLLDGVYAIVLVDQDKCYFARDHVGVRPLFFGWCKTTNKKNILAVASVAKA